MAINIQNDSRTIRTDHILLLGSSNCSHFVIHLHDFCMQFIYYR